jgi:glycosyltransferase involved in cell wall biosynthesis
MRRVGRRLMDTRALIFRAKRPLRILQVNTADRGGGAAKVAWGLFQNYRTRGYASWLAVRSKHTADADVLPLPNDNYRNRWSRIALSIGKMRGGWRLKSWLDWIGQPARQLKIRKGEEDFEFPATTRLLDLPPERPDIIHCHNLHSKYFDLRALSWLSQEVPVVLTLHDEWLLTGHCAYTLNCERWKIGCGHCPDLNIYPAVSRDKTAYNWQRKQAIYAKSRLYLSTPCRWLMEKVDQSILAPAVTEARILPYGVDLSIFHPGDRHKARTAAGIPQDAMVLLFTANGGRRNMFKDCRTICAAVTQIAGQHGEDLILIVLGEDAPTERIGSFQVHFVPYQENQEVVARYYQAADLYVHAARTDTFPVAVLEALACGTPVIATDVGGISEQVCGLQSLGSGISNVNRYGMDEATGILVPPGDAWEMAAGIARLLNNHSLRRRLGKNAARDARKRFDLRVYVDQHLKWYEQLMQDSTHSVRVANFGGRA